MSLKRLGVLVLGLVLAIVLVMAMPVSTAQKTETIPKETVKLAETMSEPLEIMNEEIKLQDDFDEMVENAEKQIKLKTEKIENQKAIEGAVILAKEFIIEENNEVEEIVEVEIETEETISEETSSEEEPSEWQGEVLNAYIGVVQGPSGKETYYNLPMEGVIYLMKSLGYDYEYWVREDGVKMYGDYIMCAANLELRPKGTILETSLGTAMVCDTGSFAESNPYQIDIAVDW